MTPSNRDLTIRNLKHMTRRTSGLEKINIESDGWEFKKALDNPCEFIFINKTDTKGEIIKPCYHTGQTYFLKEPHYAYGFWMFTGNNTNSGKPERMFINDESTPARFEENKPDDIKTEMIKDSNCYWYLRSPMFMFAKDARYFVKVLSVSVGRLLDITNEDCIAEGIHEWYSDQWGKLYSWDDNMRLFDTPKEAYLAEWDEINGKINGGIYHSSRNPWNFSYTYQLTDRPENLK